LQLEHGDFCDCADFGDLPALSLLPRTQFQTVALKWLGQFDARFCRQLVKCRTLPYSVHERNSMSHVLNYDGQYFRIDIAEVSTSDDPDKALYVSWCSNAFKELKDMPSQASSRIIPGPPLPKFADARRHAFDWIKTNWDSQQHARRAPVARDKVGVTYTVSLFKGDINLRVDFEEFSDA
jgi:hypothetical protein